jgi:hypothetical protein
MKSKKILIVAVILVFFCVAGYWEYWHTQCAEKGRVYLVDHGLGKSITEVKTSYDLLYKVCMGSKGL